QAEDGIRDPLVTGVQTCALPIFASPRPAPAEAAGARAPSPGPVALRFGSSVLVPPEKTRFFERYRARQASVKPGTYIAPAKCFQIGSASCRERGGSGGGVVSRSV